MRIVQVNPSVQCSLLCFHQSRFFHHLPVSTPNPPPPPPRFDPSMLASVQQSSETSSLPSQMLLIDPTPRTFTNMHLDHWSAEAAHRARDLAAHSTILLSLGLMPKQMRQTLMDDWSIPITQTLSLAHSTMPICCWHWWHCLPSVIHRSCGILIRSASFCDDQSL